MFRADKIVSLSQSRINHKLKRIVCINLYSEVFDYTYVLLLTSTHSELPTFIGPFKRLSQLPVTS